VYPSGQLGARTGEAVGLVVIVGLEEEEGEEEGGVISAKLSRIISTAHHMVPLRHFWSA